MSLNNEDSGLTKHSEDHELDDNDDNQEEDGLNIDGYNFPLPPSTTVIPLSLGKKDVSLASTHSPTIVLEPNGTSPRFSRTPTRAKRPRQTLKTFEDLREYNQNRSQAQPRVDPSEQPRTLFRDLDAEGHVVYSSPSCMILSLFLIASFPFIWTLMRDALQPQMNIFQRIHGALYLDQKVMRAIMSLTVIYFNMAALFRKIGIKISIGRLALSPSL
jgi:hypothetical protein